MGHFLVTGGAGFIGSHVADRLLAGGHSVRVIDDLSTGKKSNLRSVWDQVEFIQGSLVEMEKVQEAVRGVDAVFHEAAIPSVVRSVEDPVSSIQANLMGTVNLLVAARDSGVRRLVYASSSSVYGDSEILPKIESQTPDPRSPYALSKLSGEQCCVIFHRLYGLETVSLRYFNVFGPRQDPDSPYSGVISIFMKNTLEGKPSLIHGDGKQSRDFTYVSDVVEANMLAVVAPDAAGGVFNIACGGRASINDIYGMIAQLAGSDLEPRYGPARVGDVRHSQANVAHAADVLGFRSSIGLKEGLGASLKWYREEHVSN
jgi:UDP-glucose 4-epimerase